MFDSLFLLDMPVSCALTAGILINHFGDLAMKTRRWLGVVLSACAAVAVGTRGASAICGIPNIYGVSGPNAFVVLYSPIPPFFPPTGVAFTPIGVPFGDAALDTIVAAGTAVPPKFTYVLGPPAPPSQCSSCVVAPGAIVFAICVAPTFVGVFN